eukprot:10115386-Karenia_brevis.AAC.1
MFEGRGGSKGPGETTRQGGPRRLSSTLSRLIKLNRIITSTRLSWAQVKQLPLQALLDDDDGGDDRHNDDDDDDDDNDDEDDDNAEMM